MVASDKVEMVERLLALYRQDQAAGVLEARILWDKLDEEVLALTRGWAESAQRELEEVDSVTALGIDGYEWAFFVEAQNTVSFHDVLRVIVDNRGDPPASKALRQHALDILTGRMNLAGALRLVAADRPLLSSLPHIFQTFLPGMDPESYSSLSHAVRVAAAAALPREELLRLKGVEAPETQAAEDYDAIRREYQRLVAEAQGLDPEAEPLKREELLVRALDKATESPEPDDDIEAIQLILGMADRFNLSKYSVRRCVDAVYSLVSKGHNQPELAQSLVALGPLVAARDLKKELGPPIVECCEKLLRAPLTQDLRYSVATTGARALLWLDRSEEADRMLETALGTEPNPVSQLEIAVLKADVCMSENNRPMAAAVLMEALDRTKGLDGRSRLPAMKKLLSVWPAGRNTRELYPIVRELGGVSYRLGEPKRTLTLVTSALRLFKLGDRQAALELWSHVDFERVRYTLAPETAKRLGEVVRRAAETIGAPLDEALFDDTTVVRRPPEKLLEKSGTSSSGAHGPAEK